MTLWFEIYHFFRFTGHIRCVCTKDQYWISIADIRLSLKHETQKRNWWYQTFASRSKICSDVSAFLNKSVHFNMMKCLLSSSSSPGEVKRGPGMDRILKEVSCVNSWHPIGCWSQGAHALSLPLSLSPCFSFYLSHKHALLLFCIQATGCLPATSVQYSTLLQKEPTLMLLIELCHSDRSAINVELRHQRR